MVQKTRVDQMVTRLRDMQASTPDVEASAVVSVDGLIIASSLPQSVEEDRVSAMSAAMLSQVYIHGDKGYVLLTAVGAEAVLTVLARESAKLGLVFLEIRRAADDLTKMVG
jgi:predicted regulator of Ras-like GTPase activity (Roadblock/LC7/MglB family)